MRRTCSLSSAVTPALSTALSATIFLAASLRASGGPDIALSMASRSAVNFELMASMLPPVVLPSSNGPQVLAQRVHRVAGGIGLLAQLALLGKQRRVDGGRAIEDVGGKAALGVEVARDVADGANDRQPPLPFGDPLHRLVFRHGDVDGEAAAHSRERDDGGGQERTDFHESVRQLAREIICTDHRQAILIPGLRWWPPSIGLSVKGCEDI